MEAKILKLLAPLVTEEQTGVKLGSILYVSTHSAASNHFQHKYSSLAPNVSKKTCCLPFQTLGIDEKDLPKLTDFLVRYKDQQNEQTGVSD